MAVTPLLGSEETLPSNLKLAADAWPEAWEQEEERDDGEKMEMGKASGLVAVVKSGGVVFPGRYW